MAEERNLTRAARKAFISQPTLTNYINRLEEQLGVKLFDRSVTPIEITRAGALYIEQMKKIQLAETNLRNELRILGSMETVFHLGIGATRGNHWLPLLLPEVDSYEVTDTGESPLSKMTDWVNTTCPKCGGPAQRETDTMPQWAGSSWYFLRYMDPHNDKAFASKEALDYWSPVDWYNGGMEHTTLHLLYSRFWHKFLYDIGAVPTKEPYAKRTSHGMILGEGGEKMSKSRGNVVNPNDIVDQYGADTMRLYIMFIGDFEKAATWSNDAVKGSKRFLDRVWNLAESASDSYDVTPANEAVIHKTIKKVTEDVDSLKMNTAIAAMMTMVNELNANGCTRGDLKYLLLLLNPFAPHITEELWENLGFAAQTGKMCCQAEWPVADESKTVASTVELAVQVNGKLKGTISMPTDSEEKAVVDAALAVEKVRKATEGMQIIKTILVKNRLVNLIVKPAK